MPKPVSKIIVVVSNKHTVYKYYVVLFSQCMESPSFYMSNNNSTNIT